MANLLRIRAARTGYATGLEDAEIESGMSETEQAVAVAETTADMMEIEQDVSNANRLEDQAQGLEDAAAAIDNIDSATVGEVQLADIAADLGTAGTDAEVEIFNDAPAGEEVVSVESFTGRSIGTEGLKEMARAFWEEVKRLVKKAWEAILKFWRKITSQVPGIVKAARALRTRAEDSAGKTLKNEDKKISVGAAGMALILEDSHPSNFDAVKTAVDNMKSVASIVLDDDAKKVIDHGDALQTLIADFDIESTTGSLTTINNKVASSCFGSSTACSKPIGSDKRYGNGLTATKSVPLPGGTVLVASKAETGSDTSPLGTAAQLRSQNVSVVHHNDKDKKDVASKDIATLTLAECKKIADVVEDLAMVVKSFEEKHLRKMEQVANRMKGTGDKIAKQINDETTAQAQKDYQAAMRYVTAFAGWASSPFNRIASMSLTTCRAAIEVGNKSVSRYKAA